MLYIEHDSFLGVDQIARSLSAVDALYGLVSLPPAAEGEPPHLALEEIHTGNSLTASLVGGAALLLSSVVGVPIAAGASAIAAVATLLIAQRKNWHAGTREKYDGEKAKHESAKARVESLAAATEIDDPVVRRQALIELHVEGFYSALFVEGEVRSVTVNGHEIGDDD